MFISVIIPNYNHAPFLKQRIESVLYQTYTHFELIILDDCSNDTSREIIDSYRNHPKVSYVRYNGINSNSPFVQWKTGIELAKGDWIWIAESDDFCQADFLQKAYDALKLDPNLGLIYCDSYILNEESKSITGRFSEKKNKHFLTTKWNTSYQINGLAEVNQYLKFDCTINNVSSAVIAKSPMIAHLDKLKEFKYYEFIVCECRNYLVG